MDTTTSEKSKKEINYLNNTINQLDLKDTYGTLPPTTA